ncbi:MAG TPA: hypothetical protein DCP92_03390, partial [Nitrospiraceae bacterium]|nr:hypothetical protein [Nitrospiraceae bacterium]
TPTPTPTPTPAPTPTPVQNTYTITATAGANGTISPSGTTTVNGGANQTFTITPTAGYDIASVTVDSSAVGASSPYTFSNVSANHTISASFGAVDTDGDGVPDVEEWGPQGNDPTYDGNGDGIPDYLQNSVASFHTFGNIGYITLYSPDGHPLQNVTAKQVPAGAPAGTELPYQFVSFAMNNVSPGSSTTAVIILPEGTSVNNYYKYGPTPDNPTPHWYSFMFDGQTGAVISGNIITLHFVDGLRGDDDLTANGQIVDQGGPAQTPIIGATPASLVFGGMTAVNTASSTQSVTVSNTGLAALAISAVTITGTNAGDFAVPVQTCLSQNVASSGTCTISVSFSPQAGGSESALLTISSDDPVTPTLNIPLSGTGIALQGSLSINGGAAATKTASVTLALSASGPNGVSQMCISNTSTCTAWRTFATTTNWTLTSGDGTKTVSAWFKDSSGNTSAPYSTSILLDRTAPTNGTVTATPGPGQITLSWSGFTDAGSGIGGYKVVYAHGYTPYSCSAGTIVPDYDGTSTTYTHTGLTNATYGYRVCAIDNAGNMSTGATASAKPLDPSTNPPVGSIQINGGTAWTKSTLVKLAVTASDETSQIQMCISTASTCTAWTALAATTNWMLTSGDGTKTVNVWFRDAWDNTTPTPYSASILLDTTAPTNGTVTATPGPGQITLSWSGFTDAGSGIEGYKVVYAEGYTPPSCSVGTATYTNGTTYLQTGLTNGTTYGYRVCAIDNAGNMSTGATASATPINN